LSIPAHVAIIPDGNRRIGKRENISLIQAYVRGARRAIAVAKHAKKRGVKHLTFFGLSIENVEGRPEPQIKALMRGASFFLREAKTFGWAVRPFGEVTTSLPGRWYEPMRKRLIDLRNNYNPNAEFTIHVAVNYSGRPQHEIAPLLRIIREKGMVAMESSALDHLLSSGVPNVDLLIRTGGEQRLSGFLPFQTAYAELCFVKKFWGDFTEDDFEGALEWFADQKRNFGA
jgi:undecaprenyl diphosphate synthase